MALTVQWEGGDGITLLASGSYIGFYGATFNTSIPLSNYNSTTIVTDQFGTVNSGALPNIQYTSPGYGIWTNPSKTGSGSIDAVSFADSTLHIRITSGSSISLSSVNLIAYTGIDISDGPTDVTVVGFEQGPSAAWTVLDGSSSPLALTPHTASGSTIHDYYIGLSVSPNVKGSTATVSFALTADWY